MNTLKKRNLKEFEVSKNKMQKLKGGARNYYADLRLCEIQRKVYFQTGGNGSGDW